MAPTDKLDAQMTFYPTGREWYGENKRVDEIELGLAVKLQTWCACHMGCGGFIPNCLGWDEKTWLKEAGIDRKIFRKYLGKSEYFRAEDLGVRVLIHDAQREAKAQETSRQRQLAARARWNANADANACANACADIQKCRNAEMHNSEFSLVGEPPLSQTTPPSPRTPTNSALGKLTARETQPAEQDDQDEPPTQWGGQGEPTLELVKQIFEQRFQAYGVSDREAIETSIVEFWDGKQSHGWKDENGEPVRSWMNCARGYADKCAKEKLEAQGGTPSEAAHADASNAPTLADVQEVIGGEIAKPDAIAYAKACMEPPPGDDEDEQGEDEPDFSDYR